MEILNCIVGLRKFIGLLILAGILHCGFGLRGLQNPSNDGNGNNGTVVPSRLVYLVDRNNNNNNNNGGNNNNNNNNNNDNINDDDGDSICYTDAGQNPICRRRSFHHNDDFGENSAVHRGWLRDERFWYQSGIIGSTLVEGCMCFILYPFVFFLIKNNVCL